MHPELRTFVRQFVGAAAAAQATVVVVAFVSIPLNIGGHPGELRVLASASDGHMT